MIANFTLCLNADTSSAKVIPEMSCYKLTQGFGLNFTRSNFCFTIPIIILVTLFCLVYEVAYADLSTIPPQKVQKEQLNSNLAIIENLLVKARAAISKKQLSKPKNKNAIYYLDQLLMLSPGNKRALNALTEIYKTYITVAYKHLNKKNIELAQKNHTKAKKIVNQFNINNDSQTLIDLQDAIVIRKAEIQKLIVPTREQQTLSKKNEKNRQMIAELANFKREITMSQPKVDQYKVELKTQGKKQQEASRVLTKKPSMSLADQERIVVIVNKKNKVSSLTINELKSLYKKQKRTWSNGEGVTLFLPPPTSDEFLWLARNVFLKKSSSSVMQFYMKGLVRNKLTIPATSTNSVFDVSRITGGIAIVKAGKVERQAATKIVFMSGS